MRFDAVMLRRGELIAVGGGVVLCLALFLLPWFRVAGGGGTLASGPGAAASLDGWQSLSSIRWILLLAAAVSVALVVFTATLRSPAIPVTFSMFTTVLGVFASLLVLYRVIDHPGVASTAAGVAAKPGLYVGLLAAVTIAYGGYLSMRTEGSPFGDPASIETVPLGRTGPGPGEHDSGGREEPGSPSRTESSSAVLPGRDAERA